MYIPHFPSAVNHHGFVEFLGRFDPFWLRGIESCDAAESQVKISHLRFDRLLRTHLEGIHPCWAFFEACLGQTAARGITNGHFVSFGLKQNHHVMMS